MEANITTAVEGCDRYCDAFEIEMKTLDISCNKRVYRCRHMNQCLAILKALEKAREKKV